MRTTIRLNDHLLREAKQYAARTGRTLTAVIEDALREALERGVRRPRRGPVTLPTFRGDGIQPGANLDNTAGLLELMDRSRDPS